MGAGGWEAFRRDVACIEYDLLSSVDETNDVIGRAVISTDKRRVGMLEIGRDKKQEMAK